MSSISRVASTVRASSGPAPGAAGGQPRLAKFTRPAEVAEVSKILENATRVHGLASSVWPVLADARATVTDKIYDKDIFFKGKAFSQPTALKITKAPPAAAGKPATLKLTLLINVSGHTDEENKFARSNTYRVDVTLPDGTTKTFTGIKRSKAVEYVTAIDIEIPLQKGTTTITGTPEATSVGGYSEGRTIKITY